ESTLIASDAVDFDNFGYEVDISPNSNFIFVGAIGRNGGRGGVYVFNYSELSWSEHQFLLGTNIGSNDIFGISISLADNFAAIGTNNQEIYVYTQSDGTWAESEI